MSNDRYQETLDALAHEIWAVAQLAPGEGIADGAARVEALLREALAALKAENEALRAERDALAKDAAKYRWGINKARWVRSEQEAYVAIPVAPDADLSCVAMRDAAIDQARGKAAAAEMD